MGRLEGALFRAHSEVRGIGNLQFGAKCKHTWARGLGSACGGGIIFDVCVWFCFFFLFFFCVCGASGKYFVRPI